MKNLAALLVMMAFVSLSLPVVAQDLPKAAQYEEGTWYVVTYYKFKSGMTDEALDLVYKYLVPADKASGRHVIHFDIIVGEWDHVAYFPMEGPGDLIWQTEPSYVKLVQELARQGGMERVQELDKYESYIDFSRSEVVLRRKMDE